MPFSGWGRSILQHPHKWRVEAVGPIELYDTLLENQWGPSSCTIRDHGHGAKTEGYEGWCHASTMVPCFYDGTMLLRWYHASTMVPCFSSSLEEAAANAQDLCGGRSSRWKHKASLRAWYQCRSQLQTYCRLGTRRTAPSCFRNDPHRSVMGQCLGLN
jgi:hypothetical protein